MIHPQFGGVNYRACPDLALGENRDQFLEAGNRLLLLLLRGLFLLGTVVIHEQPASARGSRSYQSAADDHPGADLGLALRRAGLPAAGSGVGAGGVKEVAGVG